MLESVRLRICDKRALDIVAIRTNGKLRSLFTYPIYWVVAHVYWLGPLGALLTGSSRKSNACQVGFQCMILIDKVVISTDFINSKKMRCNLISIFFTKKVAIINFL